MKKPKITLAKLLRGVRKKNLHKEIWTDEPVGKEIW
jgi:antitoxin component of MazEF toxin-antitoxin module